MNPKEIKRLKLEERRILSSNGADDKILSSPRLLGVKFAATWPDRPLTKDERRHVTLVRDRLTLILHRIWEGAPRSPYAAFSSEYIEKELDFYNSLLERR